MTDQAARPERGTTRRTTVPHPQRWRSPREAGWPETSGRTHAAPATSTLTPSASPADVTVPAEPAALAIPTFGRYGRPVRRFRNMVVYAARPSDGAAWVDAKRAELEIFAVRNGWATPDSVAAGEVLEYVPYAERSEIFIATAESDPSTAVGVARMIWGTDELPLEEQFLVTRVHRLDPEWVWMLNLTGYRRVAEWATLGAVGSNLAPMFALWSAVYRSARARGIDFWVQSIVELLFSGYRDGFKMPLLQIGEHEVVVGAESIPTVLSLEEIGIGPMVGWDLQLKRELFGDWVERRSVAADPNDFDLV